MIVLIDSDIIAYKLAFAYADEPWAEVKICVDNYINEILALSGAQEYKCFLTGSGCRRREKYPDYKGHRKQEKPEYWEPIREHLIKEHNAIVTSDGDEADDILVLEQSKDIDGTILCSSDKDMNIQQGKKYNPDKKIIYHVSEHDAECWFQCQMLIGDTADNIKGIPGIGKMKAYKILEGSKDYKLSVIAQYRKYYGEDFEYYYYKNLELLDVGGLRFKCTQENQM